MWFFLSIFDVPDLFYAMDITQDRKENSSTYVFCESTRQNKEYRKVAIVENSEVSSGLQVTVVYW